MLKPRPPAYVRRGSELLLLPTTCRRGQAKVDGHSRWLSGHRGLRKLLPRPLLLLRMFGQRCHKAAAASASVTRGSKLAGHFVTLRGLAQRPRAAATRGSVSIRSHHKQRAISSTPTPSSATTALAHAHRGHDRGAVVWACIRRRAVWDTAAAATAAAAAAATAASSATAATAATAVSVALKTDTIVAVSGLFSNLRASAGCMSTVYRT